MLTFGFALTDRPGDEAKARGLRGATIAFHHIALHFFCIVSHYITFLVMPPGSAARPLQFMTLHSITLQFAT